jgi:hypothetical protein
VPDHRVDQDAVARAEERVDAGTYDEETGWSHAAPSADFRRPPAAAARRAA